MSNMNSYMPVHLLTGEGCLAADSKQLSKLGNLCLIVTGRNSAKACGAYDDAIRALGEQKITYLLFDEISQNPQLTDCLRAAELLQEAVSAAEDAHPFILGIGGGSPLDAAKCIAVLAANPGMDQAGLYSLKWPIKPYPIALIGTTAGTGSEVTKVSVITTPDGRKKSFNHNDIYPEVSFGDPRYTMSMPYHVTVSTAIDAYAHCVESYFSRLANEISQAYAVRGIRMLLPILGRLAEMEDANLTMKEREVLYHASIYGGLAINITGTCLPHTMGYLLTEQHGLPHGYACAAFLSVFFAHNKKEKPELTEQYLQEIGWSEKELLALIDRLLAGIRAGIHITEEEIEREHGRWIGNGSLKKTWGDVTADQCDAILRDMSAEGMIPVPYIRDKE